MPGDPRIQIPVTEDLAHLAHETATREGWEHTSAWLRHLLVTWDGRPLRRERRTRQLSVRLHPSHMRRLAHIARASRLSKSEAFALLIEKALHSPSEPATAKPAFTEPEPNPPTIPDLGNHRRWAELILNAAERTPHKFGQHKAFIAGVLDELVAHLQPEDPATFNATVRALLPELNRLDLIALTRADLAGAMEPDLVTRSQLRYLNADFHFVDIPMSRNPESARPDICQ